MSRNAIALIGGGGIMTPGGVFVPAGAAVEPVFHDTFTAANGTEVHAHTIDVNDLGASWNDSFYEAEIQNNMLTHEVADGQNGSAWLNNVGTWQDNDWEIRFKFQVTEDPVPTADELYTYVHHSGDATGSGDSYVQLSWDGASTVRFEDSGGANVWTDATWNPSGFSPNTEYELIWQIYQVGAAWHSKVYLDGVLQASSEDDASPITTAEATATRWRFDIPEVAAGENIYRDDLKIYNQIVFEG